jgi:hypothetical protein
MATNSPTPRCIVGADVGAKPTPFMANISPVGYTHGDQFAHATMYCRCHRRGETHAIYGEYFARGIHHRWRIFRPWDTPPMANISPVGYTIDGDQFAHAAINVDTVVGAKPTPFMANISPVGQRRWRPIRPWCPRHDHRRRGATRTSFMPAPAPSGHTCFHKKGDICPTPPPNSPR